MQSRGRKQWALAWRSRPLALIGLAAFGIGLTGCAQLIDDVTSRNFFVRGYIRPPDPMNVLRTSTDGDERAAALRRLREPNVMYAGFANSREAEEEVWKVLTDAATADSKVLCRLAAIETLGGFRDPRAVQILVTAHDTASRGFPADTATTIQCQALMALGRTGHADAIELLMLVAKEPPPAPELSEPEKQLVQDRKIAAVRALGHFNHYQATETLLRVLQNERDIALRDRAHASLQQATGRRLPPDPKAWDEFLHPEGGRQPAVEVVKQRGFFDGILSASWWGP